MRFSIIIPTYNNCDYLKLCIDSIRKNSSYDHQIIVHINGIDKETQNYINHINIDHTKTNKNVGLCKGVNTASKKVNTNYIVSNGDSANGVNQFTFSGKLTYTRNSTEYTITSGIARRNETNEFD